MNDVEVIEYLKRHFTYHPDGKLTRSDRKGGAGSYDKDGYLIIKIKGKQYKAHRLVYAIHNNRFPIDELDHINRIKDDNRIENLRDSNRLMNVRNTFVSANKDTGVRGVHLDKYTKGLKNRYTTRLGGKSYRFRTLQEAINKRNEYYDKDMEMMNNE